MSHAPTSRTSVPTSTHGQLVTDSLTRRSFLFTGLASAGAVAIGGSSALAEPAGSAVPVAQRSPDVVTGWTRAVYAQVKAERVMPPPAARIYAYVALAGFEAVVDGMPRHRSLSGRLNDFECAPRGHGLDWEVAANEAMGLVAQAMFADRSEASLAALEDHRAATAIELAARTPRAMIRRSVRHGRAVGRHLVARSTRDGYAATRGMTFTPPVGIDLWVPTPPNFGSSIEPHWGRTQSFTLLSNDECRPAPHLPYSEMQGSPFWLQGDTVRQTVANLTDDQRATALFWRDNPDGTTGLPSGHWMLTACAAGAARGLDLGGMAEVLALTGIALADGFTSCWTEKYESNLLRPVTYIRRVIDPEWNSPVNSPAFPEYTSGHSVGSGAAAGVLTALLGDVTYVDDVGLQNGYPLRTFTSFRQAADEAAISRLYGGIHYPMGIEAGLVQGAAVAEKVLQRAVTRRSRHRITR